MFGKILLSVYFMGVTQAVFINTNENHTKDLNKENPHGWQMIKVYHPPNSQAFGYKYEPYAYPKYEFEYSVSDKKTGDQKHHHEARDGDRVRGEYSLVESDGSLRKVEYHADDHNGFNAIVSKTVNKHGDHAVSVTDHTRFFYPVGHGIKINHYFPGSNYHNQNSENTKESIPVHEEKESAAAKNEEPKALVIESGDKIMLFEPQQARNVPVSKPEAVETTPVQVVPAVVSMIATNLDDNKINTETTLNKVENTEFSSTKDMPSIIEDQPTEKEDQHLDSEVASSYYHSKIYYIGY